MFNAISFDDEEDKKDIYVLQQKMTELTEACEGTVNVTYEWYIFNTHTQ